MQELTQYELTYIISLEQFENIDSIKDSIEKLITQCGGQIKKQSQPQKRKLAYAIKGTKNGIYIVNRIQLEKQNVKKLENKLKPVKEILRCLIVQAQDIPEGKKQEEKASKIKEPTDKQEEKTSKKTERKSKVTQKQPEKIKQEKKSKKPAETKKTKKAPKPEVELDDQDDQQEQEIKSKKDKLKIEELDKKIEDILKDDLI